MSSLDHIGTAERMKDGRVFVQVRAESDDGTIGDYRNALTDDELDAAGWKLSKRPEIGEPALVLPSED